MSKSRKDKILDVAEKLLAQRGLYGVSLVALRRFVTITHPRKREFNDESINRVNL